MRKKIVLHSPLMPVAASEALRRSIDEEHLMAVSLSGFGGGRPVLGEVSINSFRLRKRISYRNDFARQFYGRLEPESGGTRIEGYFAARLFPRIFITLWFTGVISAEIFILFETVRDLQRGTHYVTNPLLGLTAPLGLLLFGIGLLWFCGRLSRNGERFILEHLKTTLSARAAEPNTTQGQG